METINIIVINVIKIYQAIKTKQVKMKNNIYLTKEEMRFIKDLSHSLFAHNLCGDNQKDFKTLESIQDKFHLVK